MKDNKEIEMLLLPTKEAAKMLSVSRNHFTMLHNSGRLGPLPIRLGRRTLWNRSELETWVAAGCPVRRQWQDSKRFRPAINA